MYSGQLEKRIYIERYDIDWGMALDDEQFRKTGAVFGVAAFVLYVLGTIASAYYFQGPFDPLHNWISDLGNSTYNPQGAIIYNWGSILTGILLIPFFASFGAWYYGLGKTRWMLLASEILGLGTSLGLIMLGIYSEDAGSMHTFWSIFTFATLILVVLLVNITLYNSPKLKKYVVFYGFLVVLTGLLFTATYTLTDGYTIMEWLTVYSAFLWLLLFARAGYVAKDVVTDKYKKIKA